MGTTFGNGAHSPSPDTQDILERRPKRTRRWFATALLVLTTCPAAAAPAAPSSRAARENASPDSPRAAVKGYLEACRTGDFEAAATYLQLPSTEGSEGATLARHLKLVLDRNDWPDPATISGSDSGDLDDGLAAETEEVARIQPRNGPEILVRLVRGSTADGPRWLFSKATVRRLNGLYGSLENRWLLDRIPSALLRHGPLELALWQWMALPLGLGVAVLAALVLGRLTRAVFVRLARRTATTWDDAWLARTHAPLTLAFTIAVFRLLLPFFGLNPPAQEAVSGLLRAGFLFVFFWILFRSIEVTANVASGTSWAATYPASRSLVPLGSRAAKVAVLATGALALLAQFGYPVTSLLAGLGIGGLALALAAQKTVENVFGAFSIGIDQPFREGDFVRIEDFVGTVEAIGLRSTRIRTLDRTVISVPNGKLADQRVESFAVRDRIRLSCSIGLVYETSSAKLRQILDGFEQALRAHPKIWPDAVVVRFAEFGDSSLNINVMAWFVTQDYDEFQLIRQNVLLEFMAVVEAAGSSFAFPTRTLHIASMPGEVARRTNQSS